jgi:hypothetical protein
MAAPREFVAIIGDLVASRDVADRAAVQADLKRTLEGFKIRQPVAASRAAGPEFTAGDEVQVLLAVEPSNPPGHAVMAFLSELTEDVSPVRIAFGIGAGSLSTELRGPIHELDGPCFHRARKALDEAKRRGRWAVVLGVPSPYRETVRAILRLTGEIRAAWTDRQREIVRRRRDRPLQKDVARELGVSPSVVSEVLSAARHDAVLEAEHAVVVLLNRALSPEAFRGADPRLRETEAGE